jgi:hypothetical protein
MPPRVSTVSPMVRWLTNPFVGLIAIAGAAVSAPAAACMCSSPDAAALEASASKFDQVYAGLIISTQRIPAAQERAPASSVATATMIDPGYWMKSNVLVLRVWRGRPAMVTEVWTRVATSCDLAPFPGLYFVALTDDETDRGVAEYSFCNDALRSFVTQGPATFHTAGVATFGAVVGLGCVLCVWLFNTIRRRGTFRLTG